MIHVCESPIRPGAASRDDHVALQKGEKGLHLACSIELKVDHDVIPIVGRLENSVAAHAQLLPPSVYRVEGHLPGVEVADRMFDLQDVYVAPLLICSV